MDRLLFILRALIPKSLRKLVTPPYHFIFALAGAILFGFPSKKLVVIGVTGTKGKSTVAEFLNSILEEAGYTTALATTIRFKTAEVSNPNLLKMTMPGRFFLQHFLHEAVGKGCTHAILEMTSEGAKQYRHTFIALDALIFTNLAPEHLESHGSMEAYFEAKFSIGKALEGSSKRPRHMIANADDSYGRKFLSLHVEHTVPFSLKDAGPYRANEKGIEAFIYGSAIHSPLVGTFNIANMLAAAACAKSMGIDSDIICRGLQKVKKIPGRVERVSEGQDFDVIVDYAHTPDSLESLYKAFPREEKICVLGSAGGGRDRAKRSVMGGIAEKYCREIILTNEDPYDEDPRAIVEDVARGISKESHIIMDRREAIREALTLAKRGDVVLITGKGTDPYIMEARGKKTLWSDAEVAREELRALL